MLENDQLDVLGHQLGLHKLYTQISCIYPLPDGSDRDKIVTTLRRGLDTLAVDFPWLAGHVICEGASEGVTGILRVVPVAEIPLVVKDLTTDPSAPTMESLRSARFPMAMLDENVIAPCLTLNFPDTSFGLVDETGPVFAVQVNFLSGGLLITFVGQHNAMDITGQAAIIEWLSQACHGIPLSPEIVSIGNMDKSKAVPLLDDSWELGAELDEQIVKPSTSTSPSTTTNEPAPASWRYIDFSAASAQTLKSQATKSKDSNIEFISTDDAISAFIWKCVSQAREHRLGPDTISNFVRSLDARQCLRLPDTYPGTLTNMSYSKLQLQDLNQRSLGSIASVLRNELDPAARDLAHDTRALVTMLQRSPDKTKFSIAATLDTSRDISLSSWAKINLYDVDFNLGVGNPEAVRRPSFIPVESLMYVMPKSPSGDWTVGICLRDDDWEHLNAQKEWVEHTTYIG